MALARVRASVVIAMDQATRADFLSANVCHAAEMASATIVLAQAGVRARI